MRAVSVMEFILWLSDWILSPVQQRPLSKYFTFNSGKFKQLVL